MLTKKILVVDDNDDHRNAIQYLLKKQGYPVILAQNGAIGIRHLEEHIDIKVLIVDLAMLEISGVELLENIRHRKHPLRRIVLTGYDEELPFEKAEELKVFSYLNKPISKHALLFTVKAAFNDLYVEELEEELGIAKKWEELGQITGDFIHLVGNKVGIIPNYIESIMEELKNVTANVQEKFNQINEIIGQISTLEKMLLTPFKKTVIEKVNVTEIFEIAIELIKIPKDINVIKNYPPEKIFVNSNSIDLQKVIEEIILNAINAMQNSRKKEITISIEEGHNETAQITIHDTGSGIKDCEKDKIFRPFYSTKCDRNYGLGLFSAKNTLAKFRGTIKFESNENKGTFFIITLPIWKDKNLENKNG